MSEVSLVAADHATRAEFLPTAGMLCRSLVHDGDELLDQRRGLAAYVERGSTMGIPLLYPWANRLGGFTYQAAGREVRLPEDQRRIPLDPGGLPIHGVVPGLMRWEVVNGSGGASEHVRTRLRWHDGELLDLFPYVHEVQCEAGLRDSELTLTTVVRATGEDHVPVSFGYHPYLRLPAVPRSHWRVELPELRRLALDSRMLPTGERLEFRSREFELADSSWDDAFELSPGLARFAVSAGGWRIELDVLAGYRFAQLYAAPGQDLICFEPMTAPANALVSGDGLVVLAPGEEHRASFSVRVKRRA